ncbi:hypothetical protein [Elizabethkingia anophelis]|uniref:hypothetical protein n=1 Tax=Elizabethkingia anophelis TaxID=1117645 RepID=UPI00136C0097|nr:hypothetical protein [Elizabethkingia anophelis]MCT4142357.1 hypothetical protein [Elizabethkingia anophelis]MCT4277963.1 hypothetical protein [Elizabethkingia anophelis]MCT4281377.1 hypothetical protein [Elizabethkingia anophelis]MYY44171.1 hypothetical protein [Elizabethkingia anophelis]
MKKIIIPVFLFLGSFCFSQSVTEKYNSIYNRYEYYNSSGNIIGYKKYNNLSRQWEYYDLNKTQYERQPRQYGDYIQPYNLDLIERALQQKQRKYDVNFQYVKSKIDNIINDIRSWNVDSSTKSEIIKRFGDAISENLGSRDIDYSSNEETSVVMDWLYNTLESIVTSTSSSKNNNNYSSTSHNNSMAMANKTEKITPTKTYKGVQKVYTNSSITDKPSMGDGEIQLGTAIANTVTVLEKYNEKFYKVKSGNIVGYLWSGWFKN